MNVGEICNRRVVIADASTDVVEAARLMRKHHVGDVVIVRHEAEGPVPIGIVTDRDVVTELLSQDLAAAAKRLSVADLFTGELLTALEDDDPAELLKRMRAKGVRRVPVVDDRGVLQGIVTLDDLLELLAEMFGDAAALAYRQPRQGPRRDRSG